MVNTSCCNTYRVAVPLVSDMFAVLIALLNDDPHMYREIERFLDMAMEEISLYTVSPAYKISYFKLHFFAIGVVVYELSD